jgi:hypothetical protein
MDSLPAVAPQLHLGLQDMPGSILLVAVAVVEAYSVQEHHNQQRRTDYRLHMGSFLVVVVQERHTLLECLEHYQPPADDLVVVVVVVVVVVLQQLSSAMKLELPVAKQNPLDVVVLDDVVDFDHHQLLLPHVLVLVLVLDSDNKDCHHHDLHVLDHHYYLDYNYCLT